MNPLEMVFEAVQVAGVPQTAEEISYGSVLTVGQVRQLAFTLTQRGFLNQIGNSYGIGPRGAEEGLAGVRRLFE